MASEMENHFDYPSAGAQFHSGGEVAVSKQLQRHDINHRRAASIRDCDAPKHPVRYSVKKSGSTNRAFVVYEKCLDVLFHCISCKRCDGPTQNIAKFVDSNALFVKVYCSSGHQLLHWSSCSSEGIQMQRTFSVKSGRVQGVNTVTGSDRSSPSCGISGDLSCDERADMNDHRMAGRGEPGSNGTGPVLVKIEEDNKSPSPCGHGHKEGPEPIHQQTALQLACKANSGDAVEKGSTVSNVTQPLLEEVDAIDVESQILQKELAPGLRRLVEEDSGKQPIYFTERIRTSTSCRFCCKAFPVPGDLELHERTHTGERPYECRYCSKGFVHWSHVKSHELTHTGFRAFACCFCGKRFPLSTQCRAHERMHVMQPLSSDATTSIVLSSEDAQTFEMTTSTKGAAVQNVEKATHIDFENSKCTSSARQSLPTSHKATSTPRFDSTDVPFVPTTLQPNILCCQFCGKQLSSMECRKLHERIHTGEKPYKCSYCSKMFADKSVCRIHERIHTGDRPYTCRFCGRKFSQSSHCRGHERTHTGEVPYKCQYCGQSFRYKTSQRNHERLHFSDTISACKVCLKIFKNEEDCRIHEEKHHSLLISRKNGASRTGHMEARLEEDGSNRDEMHLSQEEGSEEGEENVDRSVSVEDETGRETCVDMDDDLNSSDAVISSEEDKGSKSNALASGGIGILSSEGCECLSSQICSSKECKNKGMDPRPSLKQGYNCLCADKTACSHNIKETELSSQDTGSGSRDVGMGSLSQDVNLEKVGTLWECSHCPKQLPSLSLLRKHELMHRSLKPFNCQHCPKLFAQLSNCKMHERTHMEVKPWSCTYCGRRFADKSCCKKHEYLHTVKPFRCSFCEKSYTAHSKLLAHERIHMGTSSHACQFCGKLFPDPSHCRSHERTHTGEKPFKCTHCDKKFPNRSSLNKHEGVHNVGTPFKCTYCEKCFKTPTAVRKHELNHTLSAKFKCCYCQKGFKLKQSLQAHERCHTGEKPFPCRHCDKRFSGLTARSAHERIHTGELPYKCVYCNRLFRHSNSLTRHIRNHTGERPYECSHCGEKFKDLKQKKVHERVHTGERPFACLFCGKTFRDSSTMVKHKRIHTGVRPYKCAYCSETFVYCTTRKKHEQTHHREGVTIALTE